MKKLIIPLTGMFLFSSIISCSTSARSMRTSELENSSVKTYELRSHLDIDPQSKIKGQRRIAYLFGIKIFSDRRFAEGVNLNESSSIAPKKAMSAAIYHAVNGTEYDMLINPIYQSEVKNYLIYKKLL